MENTDANIEKVNTDKCKKEECECTGIFSLPPKQYALLSSILGVQIIENLTLDQQNSLGNFFVSLGSSMLAAAAQGQLLESCSKK